METGKRHLGLGKGKIGKNKYYEACSFAIPPGVLLSALQCTSRMAGNQQSTSRLRKEVLLRRAECDACQKSQEKGAGGVRRRGLLCAEILLSNLGEFLYDFLCLSADTHYNLVEIDPVSHFIAVTIPSVPRYPVKPDPQVADGGIKFLYQPPRN